MGSNTAIEWTDHTFNLWRGCEKVHTGCKHCYAEKQAKRNPKILGEWGPHGTRIMAALDYKRQPLAWNQQAEAEGRRHRVFCASMADVFEDWDGPIHDHLGQRVFKLPTGGYMMTDNEEADSIAEWQERGVRPATLADLRAELFRIIDATPWLDWQLLTKRPENIGRLWCSHANTDGLPPSKLHRKNVWLGTSVSDQATADTMIPELLKCGDLAPVLFLSCEPLLGPIDLIMSLGEARLRLGYLNKADTPTIGWVIAGGESGPHARPMHPDWVRMLRDPCVECGIPFFFKQWGEWLWDERDVYADAVNESQRHYFHNPTTVMKRIGKEAAGNVLDGRTWQEFPEVQHAGV